MQMNPVNWFEIYVQDMQRAKAFYESVFAVQLQKQESAELEMCVFPMQKNDTGISGALVKTDDHISGGHSTLVYFVCTDCAIEAKRAKDNGGQILKAKFSIGKYGFIAIVADTEGNMIGLHSMQ